MFDGGVVRGRGRDDGGEFVIKGSYYLETREVRWTKKYVGRQNVYFRGFREGLGIWGVWQIDGKRAGFHVWPLLGRGVTSF